MKKDARIYIAGHSGMVGGALIRQLEDQGFTNLLTAEREDLDLCDGPAVAAFFAEHKPEYVFLAAARVGGIADNVAHPADFGRDNALIAINVLDASHQFGVQRLLYFASSCIYPTGWDGPISEAALLTGPPEPTNEMYALAKIFGTRLCAAYHSQHNAPFFSVVPCNLYGPGDRFDETYGHVVASLMVRFHRAVAEQWDQVLVWGDGTPRRELMHVDDMADAAVFLMHRESFIASHVNIGMGDDVSIAELATMLARIVGYRGKIVFDDTRPNGIARKLIDSSRMADLGWVPKFSLEQGLTETYKWYSKQRERHADREDHVSPCS